MASLLFAGGVLAYEKIKESKAKKTAKKAHNAARYSDLESSTCTCNTAEKESGTSKGCPIHDPSTSVHGESEEKAGETKLGGQDHGVRNESGGPVENYGSSERAPKEEEPPRYEDVAGPVGKRGFRDRVMGKREKEMGDGVVR